MKIHFILAFALIAFKAFCANVTLMVDTNGTINAPTNFFRANTNKLSAALNGVNVTNIGLRSGTISGTFTNSSADTVIDGAPGGGGGVWPRSFTFQNFNYIQNSQANSINWYGKNDATISGGNLYLTTYTNLIFNTPEIASFSLTTNAVPVLVDPVNGYVKFVPLEQLQLGTTITSGKIIGKSSTANTIVSGTVSVTDVASAAALTTVSNTAAGSAQKSANLSDLASAATAKSNLGLVAIASSGSASDLTTGVIPALRMMALTGDITTGAGSVATTLAASGVTAASYGSASAVPVITFDAKGRATTASTAAITPAAIGAVAKAGDTLTGPLLLAADPVTALGASTKQYVDVVGTIATNAATAANLTTVSNTVVVNTANTVVNTSAIAIRARQASTVAAMQALTGVADGDQVVTAGRTTAGDGGGAAYYYSASSAATTNNGAIFTATGMGTGRFIARNNSTTVSIYGGVKSTFPPRAWAGVGANTAAIGTNDFSIYVMADFPTFSVVTNCPTGRWHGIAMLQNYSGSSLSDGYDSASSIECNYSSSLFYILFRGTDSASSSASSALLSFPISIISSFCGSVSNNFVLTRSGTNVNCYINGTQLVGGTLTRGSNFANSVALGNTVRLQIGSSSSAAFAVWPARVYSGGLFSRVLSGSELVTPSSATSPASLVSSGYSGGFPQDATQAIQSAIDYTYSVGGGTVIVDGTYYIAGSVFMRPGIILRGDGVNKLQQQNSINNYGGAEQSLALPYSRLFTGFDSTNQMIVFDGLGHSGAASAYIKNSTDAFNGELYTTYTWGATVSGLTLLNNFSLSGDAIQVLYASVVSIRDIGFVSGNGYFVNAYYSGQIYVENVFGSSGRGISLWSCSDSQIYDADYGGSGGAGLSIFASPAVMVSRCKIYNAGKYVGGAATANTSTDVVSVSSGADNWQTGDIVTFEGTPPTPLTILTPYFIYKTGALSFKIASNRAAAVAGTGIDITTAGSFSIYPAPCVNLWGWLDNQLHVSGNRFEESFENNILIQGSRYSTVNGNGLYRSGLGNSANTFGGAVSLSNTNVTFSGNRFGKRFPADGSNFGLYGINVSTNNSQITLSGNSFGDVTTEVNVDAAQLLSEVGTSNSGSKFWGFGAPHLNVSGIVAETTDSKTLTMVGRGSTATIQYIRSMGSPSAPTPPTSGTQLGGVLFSGYMDTNNNVSSISSGRARFLGWAGETFTTTANGTYLTFETTPNGSIVSAEVFRIAPTLVTSLQPISATHQAGGTAPTCTGATIGTGAKNNAGFVTTTTTGVTTCVITFSVSAPTGWAIAPQNNTTANLIRQTGSTTTTATFMGTTVNGDVLSYIAMPY